MYARFITDHADEPIEMQIESGPSFDPLLHARRAVAEILSEHLGFEVGEDDLDDYGELVEACDAEPPEGGG